MTLSDHTATSTALTAPQGRPVGAGWTIALGMVLTLAGIKEIARRLSAPPVSLHALNVSRRERMIGVALLLRVVKRAGETALVSGR